jgi:small subunit ribosomal protein S21
LENRKAVNTESVGSTESGVEISETDNRGRAVKAKMAPSSDGFFRNNPDAVSEKQKIFHEITVDHNVEKAMRVLKRKLIREGLFKELKMRKYYEKPCEKKKRKSKESVKRARKEEARAKKFMSGLV